MSLRGPIAREDRGAIDQEGTGLMTQRRARAIAFIENCDERELAAAGRLFAHEEGIRSGKPWEWDGLDPIERRRCVLALRRIANGPERAHEPWDFA